MSNELKVGLTVILAVIAGWIGFRYMSDMPLFRQTQEVVVTFDRVDGIASGSMVYMKGVQIGTVRQIRLDADRTVRVNMNIERGIEIPEDSQALLTSLGIIDGKAIVIEPGSSSRAVEHGGEIRGTYVETITESLERRGEELGEELSESIAELNRFLVQLNETFNPENRESIGRSIGHIETTSRSVSEMLENRQQELEETISSANRVMAQLDTLAASNRPRIDSTMASIERSMADFENLTRQFDQTAGRLDELLMKINEGEGSVGRMMNDPSLYQNVDSLTVELRNLIEQINENPGRYLRHMRLIEIF